VVTVPGKRLEPGVSSFSRAEVRQLPGAFGDPFRALEALPGVTPVFSGLPYFYVRGAPPGNVGYFLDDIEVPLLYHFALGPSVVNPAMVDRVDLFPGAYPARYGRFAGAILAAKTLPPEHRFHGETTIRIFDAGGVVEAPFAERRGAALVGGRYSYTALALSLLAPGVDLQYWDYQARVAFAVGRHDTLTLFGFGSYDYLGQRGETGFSTQFHRVSLRADHAVSKNTDVRVSAAVGLDRTATGDLFGVRDRSGALRTDIDHRVSRTAELRVGSDITLDAYDIRLNPNSTSSDTSDPTSRATGETLFPTRLDTASGLWADVVLKPEPGVSVTPGLRFDYYSSNGFATVGVDPRISTRIELSRRLSVVHTLGLAHQPPSFIVPIPGFSISGLDSGLQESVQASSGIEADLFAHITGTLTVFDAIFLNMTDPLSSGEIERYLDRTQGSAVGLEFSLRRPFTERLGGFLSYTLSRSMRSFGRETYPSRYDRTHVLNLALGYKLGRGWMAGSRLVYYSGFPVQDSVASSQLFAAKPLRKKNPPRSPGFYRIDARLEKRWQLSETSWWSLVFEFLNATLRKEPVDVNCDVTSCRVTEIGPVSIPSIGVEAGF
jgi:hypothetical protein